MFGVRMYWALHVFGALFLVTVAGICFSPDRILPESLHSPRESLQRFLTNPLMPFVAPNSSQDEKSTRVLMEMVREKYEDEIEQLKKKKKRLKAKLPR